MSTQRVVFAGREVPGFDRDTAIANLARLLKRTPEQAAAAFSGKPLVLKKAMPAADAERLCQTLQRAGLMVHAETEESAAPAAAPATPAAPRVPLNLSLVEDDDHKKEEAAAQGGGGSPSLMTCPACGREQPKADVCVACGVVIAKFLQRQAQKQAAVTAPELRAEEPVPPADTATPPLFALNVRGRIGRLRMIVWHFLAMLLFVPACFFIFVAGTVSPAGFLLLLPLIGAALFITIRVAVLRLHDRGHTGWLAALFMVPVVNLLFPLYLAIVPGDDGENAYGPPPGPNTPAVIAGAVAYLVTMVLLPLVVVPMVIASAMQQATAGMDEAAFEQAMQQAMEEAAREQAMQDGTTTTDEDPGYDSASAAETYDDTAPAEEPPAEQAVAP